MTKHVLHPLLSLLFIAATASCEKELDFRYKTITPLPVVEASLTRSGAEAVITLTTPMDEPLGGTRLTDLLVTLTDLTAGTVVTLTPDAAGVYRADTPGITGHDYSLHVAAGGGFTASSQCTMPPAAEITGLELNWVKMPYDDVATIDVTFTDVNPSHGDYYWVRIYRNGSTLNWSVVADNTSVDGTMDHVVKLAKRNEDDESKALADGDVITVSVAPISKTMALYLEALGNDSNGAPMFDGSPCLGYFLAAPLARASVTFHPADIP